MTNAPIFGMTQTLRGFTGFEDIYDGLDSRTPIMLSPRPSGRDPAAESLYQQLVQQFKITGFPVTAASQGIGPNLVAALPVPLGSLVQLWLPTLQQGPESAETPGLGYHYILSWRLRSQQANRDFGQPFHSTIDGQSKDDDGSGRGMGQLYDGAAKKRRLIPAAYDTILYPQLQTSLLDTLNMARVNMYSAAIRPCTPTNDDFAAFAPLLPPIDPAIGFDFGEMQQGVTPDPNSGSTVEAVPSWQMYEVQAKGDEMMLGLVRIAPEGVNDTWDFGNVGPDLIVSQFFGRAGLPSQELSSYLNNALLGAYVLTGTGP